MELLTACEVRRLMLARVAGRDSATKGELVAVIEWAKEVRVANETLRLVLEGSLLVTGMGADGPDVAAVADWPADQQQAYREMLVKSDSAGAH